MTTNRLYSLFSLITLLALVSVGVLAIPMVVGSLSLPPIAGGSAGQVVSNPSSSAADQARWEFRRGEILAGSAGLAAADQARWEFRRGEILAGIQEKAEQAAADRARLDFRRGEWFGGREIPGTTYQPPEPDFQSYLWYTK